MKKRYKRMNYVEGGGTGQRCGRELARVRVPRNFRELPAPME